MRIIYIHQYFLTPSEGGATRSYHLSKGMVDSGVEVEMITTHNHSYYDLRIIDGIKVHYLPVVYDQKFGFLRRIWAFLIFISLAKKWVAKLPRPDYLYISSTPLTVGMIGLWAKRKFALPYIFEVRDLWPEAPIQVGTIRNPILKKVSYALEARIYRHALKIVALSPGIANAIRIKSPSVPIHIIPNFSDTEFFSTGPKEQKLMDQYGLKDSLTITYAGAIGRVNAVEEILGLAKISQENGRAYQFVVMGKGSHLKSLLQKSKDLQLRNFFYFPFGNKSKVKELLSISDLAFISFDHLEVLKTNSPNKFFDALAAGKAILVNHKGWVHELISNYNTGYFYDHRKPSDTLLKLDLLAQDPQLLKTMQQNSRDMGEQHFSKQIAIKRLLKTLYPNDFEFSFSDEVYILTA